MADVPKAGEKQAVIKSPDDNHRLEGVDMEYAKTLINKSSSVEEKLKAAEKLSKHNFPKLDLVEADGKTFRHIELEVEHTKKSGRDMVHVKADDQIALRGVVDNGKIEHEQSHGHEVSFNGTKFGKANSALHVDESNVYKKQEKKPEASIEPKPGSTAAGKSEEKSPFGPRLKVDENGRLVIEEKTSEHKSAPPTVLCPMDGTRPGKSGLYEGPGETTYKVDIDEKTGEVSATSIGVKDGSLVASTRTWSKNGNEKDIQTVGNKDTIIFKDADGKETATVVLKDNKIQSAKISDADGKPVKITSPKTGKLFNGDDGNEYAPHIQDGKFYFQKYENGGQVDETIISPDGTITRKSSL